MPMYLLFRLTILIGSRYCLQVESTCRHIWIDDSPVTQDTVAPGLAGCTPIAAGRPKPIVPRPPELIQRRGSSNLKNCAPHIWCWPTSEVTKASPLVTSYNFSSTNCGLMIVELRSYLRQSFARHSSICFHHCPMS